jgi:signal transduction histidine kinase
MKRLSLKTRLVLLHTGVMTFVVGILLLLLFSISSRELLSNVENTLEERVSGALKEIELEDGQLEFDSDLMDLEDGVYLSVYDGEHLELLYGKLPYGFTYDLSFEDGKLRSISAGETDYYVLDMEFPLEDGRTVMVRGIVSISDAERDFQYTLYIALILFPLLILLTAVCGYLVSRRALDPVSRITKTVQKIQKEKDLSKRIHLGKGTDEIYTLANTFDQLLNTIETGVNREKQFTSDVAHELRTPVSVVLMECEELLRSDHLDEEGRREVSLIDRKMKNISDMISQLLLLSRADQGRERLNLERVDLSELSQMVTEEFTEIAREKEISIEAQIEPGLFLTADQTLLIRLWGNLFENAVRYGKKGGHIWISAVKCGTQLQIQIKDDGIGILPQDLPHIWDRFYRAESSRNSDGSGLGLSMVKWIVEAHKGQISVVSQWQHGTEFTCLFPSA